MLLPMLMGAMGAGNGYITANGGAQLYGSAIGIDAITTLDWNTDGTCATSSTGVLNTDTIVDWYSRGPVTGWGSGYDIQGVVNSGSASGPAGWVNLGTQRTWQVTDTTAPGGSVVANITFTIRDAGTLATVATGTLDMSALKTL